jgi:acetylornithine deacetylase/succinyl-diaminopimelate desuccinylase-like protein
MLRMKMTRPYIGIAPGLGATVAAAVFFAALPVFALRSATDTPDFRAARDEAAAILQDFVKIDTSNPPGNETKGAQYLKTVLDREGIPSEIFELTPGRGNIVARLKGSGKKQPILLMGHIDVVGIERDKWTVDPFGGSVKDGYIYGRGSSDDKGMATACLEVFLLLHRIKAPLDRDVIYLAEAGEEGTPEAGIEYMVREHWDKIGCEFALNEGGVMYKPNDKVQYVGIATTEKVPSGMKLVAHGTSGHGSMPRLDNAITHLAAAVAKVGSWQPPMRLNETTRAFFDRLAMISPPEQAALYRALDDPQKSPVAQQRLRETSIGYNSMLRTSIVPTIIKGGFRSNVIPAEAEATLDVRALPDENIDALITELKRIIADPAVDVVRTGRGSRPASPPSPLDTEMFKALEKAQKTLFADAVTIPMMLTGATDSAELRAKGVQAYGLGSMMSDDDRSRIHGNDERISIEGLGKLVELIYQAVVSVAGTASP